MDDVLDLVGAPIELLFLICLGIGSLAGWLIGGLLMWILFPVGAWLWRTTVQGAERFLVWYRKVTWRRRMEHARKEAMEAVDAVRQEHLSFAKAAIATIEQRALTAGQTPAVRVAVRPK
ncbi:MAG: hypothetical protein GX600_09855 [Dehalococcoidia bacterium]|nr:hypothetical protein [Dehalococcoidia bacterium]